MTISEITGTKCPWFVCPMWLASGVAPFADTFARITNKRILFTGESMRALRTCNHLVSHEKAARELSYHPRPFKETVRDTLEWYSANNKVKRRITEIAGIPK